MVVQIVLYTHDAELLSLFWNFRRLLPKNEKKHKHGRYLPGALVPGAHGNPQPHATFQLCSRQKWLFSSNISPYERMAFK